MPSLPRRPALSPHTNPPPPRWHTHSAPVGTWSSPRLWPDTGTEAPSGTGTGSSSSSRGSSTFSAAAASFGTRWCRARVSLGDGGTSLSPHCPCSMLGTAGAASQAGVGSAALSGAEQSRAQAGCPARSRHSEHRLGGSGGHFPWLQADGAARELLRGDLPRAEARALPRAWETRGDCGERAGAALPSPPRKASKINFYKQLRNELILRSPETMLPVPDRAQQPVPDRNVWNGKWKQSKGAQTPLAARTS